MKKQLLFVLTVLLFTASYGQNIAINATGANADASAALDINSTSTGVLVPRMTTTQRNAISSPATGLLIYNTTNNGFEVYNGSWSSVTPSSTQLVPSMSGNSGKFLTNNGSTSSWTTIATRNAVSNSSDQAVGTQSIWNDVTGLNFSATAGTVYKFKAFIPYTNIGAGGDALDFSVTGPASPTLFVANIQGSKTATDLTKGTITAYDTGFNPGGNIVGTNLIQIEGMIITSSSGTVTIRTNSQKTGKHTIKAGAYLEYW